MPVPVIVPGALAGLPMIAGPDATPPAPTLPPPEPAP